MFKRHQLFSVFLCCWAGLNLASGSAAPPAEAKVVLHPKLLVPAYFYPAGAGRKYWDQLIQAAARVPVIAIANPASGPGVQADSNYTTVITQAQAANVKVIGYVSTSYANRPLSEVTADVDRWVMLYPKIQGIFFDEQASAGDKVDYYLALRQHTLTKIPQAFTVTNPGTECAEVYFSKNVADTICIIEKGAGLEAYQPPAWATKYPAERFYGLAYQVKKPAGMQASVKAAPKKHLGYVFITDDVLENPWDTLPPYWESLVRALK